MDRVTCGRRSMGLDLLLRWTALLSDRHVQFVFPCWAQTPVGRFPGKPPPSAPLAARYWPAEIISYAQTRDSTLPPLYHLIFFLLATSPSAASHLHTHPSPQASNH